jgi:hypothetical protein
MLFAIPSKGRAGKVKSTDILRSAVLYVPESEAEYYTRSNPKQTIAAIPDHVKGITRTRNWILDNANDLRVVMIDDDVKNQGWVKLWTSKSKHKKMTEADWRETAAQLFDVTEDLGWKLWGVATQSAPRSVYPYKPILTRSYLTASFMGIVNDGTYRFDESFSVKEDYEIGLRHAKEFGGIVAARHCYWENSHWLDAGGCSDYRTGKMELEAIKRLIALYPNQIRRVARGGSEYSIDLEW